MKNLSTVELKAFGPAKDYEQSKRFYQDLGFALASDGDGIAYFHHENVSFLLQKFYVKEFAENLMLHLLVEDVDAWWSKLDDAEIAEKYGSRCRKCRCSPGACVTSRCSILRACCGGLRRIRIERNPQ